MAQIKEEGEELVSSTVNAQIYIRSGIILEVISVVKSKIEYLFGSFVEVSLL